MARRHIPAEDFEDDLGSTSSTRGLSFRRTRSRIRSRSVIGESLQPKEELIVECAAQPDGWTTLHECFSCSGFRGYALDGEGRSSFVTCEVSGDRPRSSDGVSSSARRTRISAIMSDPICVRSDMGLEELAQLFVERRIGGVPVVDADRRPIGMVTKTDLVEAQAGGLPPTLSAKELMTPVVYAVPASASLADAAGLMAQKHVHRLAVVSRTGEVVGVLTALDLARWIASAPQKDEVR